MAIPKKDLTEEERLRLLRSVPEELAQSHVLLEAITEGTPDAIYVKSPEGRYIMANSAAARTAGMTRAAMVGRYDYEIFPPEAVAALKDHDRSVISTGQAGTYEETVIVDGQRRTYLSTKAPYRGPDGRIRGVIGISRDITDRKRQEDAMRFLIEASEFLYGPIEGRETLERLAHLAVPYVADWAVIHLLRPDGRLEQTAVAHLDQEKKELAREVARRYPPDPAKQNPVFRVVQTGQPLMWQEIPEELIAVVAEDDEHLRILGSLGLRSALIVPLIRPDRVLGTITFVTSESGRLYADEDLKLAEELARRAALAIDNERLYLELKGVAATFQRSLLPPELPQIEGVRVGAVYRPAQQAVGGDFYDIFDIGEPGWVFSMGDVCGKGVQSAAVTAGVRYTVRAVAMREGSPAKMLAAANEALMAQIDEFRFFTMVCGILRPQDPRSGTRRMTISSGGHPLPLVLRKDGAVETAGKEGTLLGVFPDPSLSDVELDLRSGDSIILYTDGALCEREGPESAEELLKKAVAACAGLDAEAIAAQLEREVSSMEGCPPADDTAFLVLQVV